MTIEASKKFVYTVAGQNYQTQAAAIDAWKTLAYSEFWTAQGFTPGQVNALTNFCKDKVKGESLRQLLNQQPTFTQTSEQP